MDKIIDLIIGKKFFKAGSVVGVAVSGGSDSMALLHLLNANKEKLDIEIVAINVIHGTREKDESDALFVSNYCKEQHIRFHKFRVEAGILAKTKGMTLEEACREARYGVFENLKTRGLVEYMAIAHHQRDQAETILLHILRGSGLSGAKGMSFVRDNFYVRPFLETPKDEIMSYIYENEIPYVEDETNIDTAISRNLLRQTVMPELRKVWGSLDNNLCNFAKSCAQDDELIRSQMNFDAIIYNQNIAKIPLTYFVYKEPLVMRMLGDVIIKLGVLSNIERKHFNLICDLAHKGENGARIDLPENLTVYKEYEYITITHKKPKINLEIEWPFKVGSLKFGDYGKLTVKKTKKVEIPAGQLMIDLQKVPSGAVWRIRKEGDFIEKFGGGIRKVKTFFVDKKVPLRLRDYLPVLAKGNEVFAIAGVEIAESLRVTEDTTEIGLIKYDLQNWE